MTDHEISYETAITVSCSWSLVKQNKTYEHDMGKVTIQHLYEADPEASLFRMLKNTNVGVEDWLESPDSNHHFVTIVDMVDCIVEFLGPDLDSLAVHLFHLGKRHIAYGVNTAEVAKMTDAFSYAIEQILGDALKDADRKAWDRVFQFAVEKMSDGMQHDK